MICQRTFRRSLVSIEEDRTYLLFIHHFSTILGWTSDIAIDALVCSVVETRSTRSMSTFIHLYGIVHDQHTIWTSKSSTVLIDIRHSISAFGSISIIVHQQENINIIGFDLEKGRVSDWRTVEPLQVANAVKSKLRWPLFSNLYSDIATMQ